MVRSRIFFTGNICSLCEETYPRGSLYMCYRCKRMYCGNCVVLEGDGRVLCLKCAVREVSPQTPKSKYSYLSIFLAGKSKSHGEVTLTFNEVEDIIGASLPKSAYEHKHWWSNIRGRSPSEAWLTVGWKVQNVNLDMKTVTFKMEMKPTIEPPKAGKRKKKGTPSSFKVLALKARMKKSVKPSKSKMALAQARLKNIERSRHLKKYKGKRIYEKRLYKFQGKLI